MSCVYVDWLLAGSTTILPTARVYFTFTFLRIYVSTLYFYSVFEYIMFNKDS